MSPMLDIQRRHASVFRIRLGDKGPNGFPEKLTDAIRITSPNEAVVQAFCDRYGGTVKPWSGNGKPEFEAYLPTTSLEILVLPGQSLQQWWEKYKKSVCVTRCDGVTDHKTKKPCTCPPDIDDRMADRNACSPMTRVNVICPDVAVVGSGALVTHSLIAAETLPQSIAVAEAALSRGLMVPARLRVVEHKGLTHYIVPQIEIVGVSLTELVGAGHAELQSVTDDPALQSVPSWKPVGELPAAPVVTVAEQLAEVATPQPKPARRNAAQPLPATGLAPRTAAEVAADAAPMVTAAKAKKMLIEAHGRDEAEALWGDRGSNPITAADLEELLIVDAEIVDDDEDPGPDGPGDQVADDPARDPDPLAADGDDPGSAPQDPSPEAAEPAQAGGEPASGGGAAANPPAAAAPHRPLSAGQKRMHALAGEAWPDVESMNPAGNRSWRETRRKGLIKFLTGRDSSHDLSADELAEVCDCLEQVRDGHLEVVRRANGEWTAQARPAGRSKAKKAASRGEAA